MIYSKNGSQLSTAYGMNGSSLSYAYDVNGSQIFGGGGSGDYDEWETEYQHTILLARNAWTAEYRADSTVVPLLLCTDQHQMYKYAKDTFQYLGLAIKWNEISASLNLGDTCGSKYTTSQLDTMLSCLSPVPREKWIGVAGNHDIATNPDEGSSYAYKIIDDETFTYLQDTYFNNSPYNGGDHNHRYGNRGNEYIIDEAHKIKYCIFASWYFDEDGEPYHTPRLSSEAVEAWISMLSSVDDYDIVILSHIQPYYYNKYYIPPVDGNPAGIDNYTPDQISKSVSPRTQMNDFLAARKLKSSGYLKDYDGVLHPYDFSNCTSDILCTLAGHFHGDRYQFDSNDTVPTVIFDAFGYDNHPMYFVNIDRTEQRVNVWKYDDACNIYNYQVPFTNTEAEP